MFSCGKSFGDGQWNVLVWQVSGGWAVECARVASKWGICSRMSSCGKSVGIGMIMSPCSTSVGDGQWNVPVWLVSGGSAVECPRVACQWVMGRRMFSCGKSVGGWGVECPRVASQWRIGSRMSLCGMSVEDGQ